MKFKSKWLKIRDYYYHNINDFSLSADVYMYLLGEYVEKYLEVLNFKFELKYGMMENEDFLYDEISNSVDNEVLPLMKSICPAEDFALLKEKLKTLNLQDQ